MPQVQSVRDLVAKMKLIPVRELIAARVPVLRRLDRPRTQLKDTIQSSTTPAPWRSTCGRPVRPCLRLQVLNFSTSKSEMTLPPAEPSASLRAKTLAASPIMPAGERKIPGHGRGIRAAST